MPFPALPSRRAKFDWNLAYDVNTLPCEKSQQEAMASKKNLEQQMNLFEVGARSDSGGASATTSASAEARGV